MTTAHKINLLRRFVLTFVVLVGIVISTKSIREPDLWWQPRTCEVILKGAFVPQPDIYSFSNSGQKCKTGGR
ncbi:MAG: hypothetical protein COB85_09795 [Bacteroidetes bacterium]|nr:MAG: hypothetical protein COB85_09795 [Bacteroidota bacterium]